ncbi:MAG: type II toxin-antitoxin system HicB family antitoxin [Bacteroidota bacterium]|jgi:predicted HicB family RNase H-like nuclease
MKRKEKNPVGHRTTNILLYKGYMGSVNFSSDDEVFWGKIEHINDLITFESDDAHELKDSFERTIDEYLAFCKEKNIQPEKPFKGSFNIRLSAEVHRRAFIKAKQEGVSLNKFIETTLEKELTT